MNRSSPLLIAASRNPTEAVEEDLHARLMHGADPSVRQVDSLGLVQPAEEGLPLLLERERVLVQGIQLVLLVLDELPAGGHAERVPAWGASA